MRKKFHFTIIKEFLRATLSPYTFNVKKNTYIVFGFLWGLPAIFFSLFIDFQLNQYMLNWKNIIHAIHLHPFHYFFLMHPFMFAFIFGTMGTIRYEKNERIQKIIETLEEEVIKKSQELAGSYRQTVESLANAIEAKDPYTRGHCQRVKEIALEIAERMNVFSKKDLMELEFACILHDIGKISVPEKILTKPGRLTEEEYIKIKKHPEYGVKILQNIRYFDNIREIILQHHERPDGRGYPYGLTTIHVMGAILSASDAFDAMTSHRPYRLALSVEEALKRLEEGAGTQFSRPIVEIFKEIIVETGYNDRAIS